jgi:hypothetical protein
MYKARFFLAINYYWYSLGTVLVQEVQGKIMNTSDKVFGEMPLQ